MLVVRSWDQCGWPIRMVAAEDGDGIVDATDQARTTHMAANPISTMSSFSGASRVSVVGRVDAAIS